MLMTIGRVLWRETKLFVKVYAIVVGCLLAFGALLAVGGSQKSSSPTPTPTIEETLARWRAESKWRESYTHCMDRLARPRDAAELIRQELSCRTYADTVPR